MAFSTGLPRKVAAIAKKLHPGRDTCHAYIVYSAAANSPTANAIEQEGSASNATSNSTIDDRTSGQSAVNSAKQSLNGHVFHFKHLRVDGLQSNAEKHNTQSTVFVGNLDFTISDEVLYETFLTAGSIRAVRVVRDKVTNVGKGFGYVTFTDKSSVALALKMDWFPILIWIVFRQ